MKPTTKEEFYKMLNAHRQGPEHNDYYVVMEALSVALTYIKDEDALEFMRETLNRIK